MRALLLAWLCHLGFVKTTSFLQPTATIPRNFTAISSRTLITSCPTTCYRDNTPLEFVSWSQYSITTTITAATIVYVVNNETNSTRTSTIYNTDIDTGYGSNLGTNNATITRTEGGRTLTRTVAYPTTAYFDYDPTYSICGTFPTSIGTDRTCVTAKDCVDSSYGQSLNTQASSYPFPSHPPIPDGIQRNVDMLNDPKGRTYTAVVGRNGSLPNPLQALFPNLNLWSCQPLDYGLVYAAAYASGGPAALSTALYLTATTTSTEGGTHKARPPENTPLSSNKGLPTQNDVGDGRPASTTAAGGKSDIIGGVPPIVVPTSVPGVMAPAKADTGPAGRPGAAAVPALEPLTTTDAGNLVVISAPLPAPNSEPSPPAAIMPGVPAQDNNDSPSLVLPSVVFDNTPKLPEITAPPEFTIGSEVVTANSLNQYIVDGQTLTPEGKITLSGTVISLPSDGTALILGDTTLPLNPPTITHPAVLTLGNDVVTANPLGQYIVDGQTLTPGGKIALSGTDISLPSDGAALIVGDTTLQLHSPTITPPAVLTLGSDVVKANSLNQYVVDGQTLTPGGVITLSGTPISLSPDDTALVVGSITTPLMPTAPPIITLGSKVVTANSLNQYTIDGQTLTPGGAITVSGTGISLSPDTTALVVGSITTPLGPTAPPVITLGTQTITANALDQYIIDGQTLTPGGAITVSGTGISLSPDATALVVGSVTTPLMPTTPPALTIGTQTITANPQGQYIIDGQTLTPGRVITVSGTPISLAADKSDVVVGKSTEALGALITSGLRGGLNDSSPQEFTGAAERIQISLHLEAFMIMLGLVVIVIL